MKIKRSLTTIAVVASIAIAFAVLRPARSAQAKVRSALSVLPPEPTPTPCPNNGPECYTVLPSDTDGISSPFDCLLRPTMAIGCEGLWPNGDEDDANNNLHYLYLPPILTDTGKLLVILGGGSGDSERMTTFIGPVAASRGYHVIGLTYPSAPANGCGTIHNHQRVLDCFGDAFYEVATGIEKSPSDGGDRTSVGQHPQDSIANRLLRVLQWASANKPGDGWGKYLINGTQVRWSEIHLAGHSNGSSNASFMGSIEEFKDVGRVSLFAGPDDGDGEGGTEAEWDPATYIQDATTDTATRYYGLVHYLNKARKLTNGDEVDPPPAYQVYKNWNTFGMEEPYNQHRFEFDPEPGFTPNFGNAHMLISEDPERATATADGLGTTKAEAHNSVIKDLYCAEEDVAGDHHCIEFGVHVIGYRPAWNCILGSGDRYASSRPISNAGPNQMVECEGNGGATVELDGSASHDDDCDILTYAWAGPFGYKTGRNPNVFCSLGFNFISLVASDDWWSSLVPTTTLVNVLDTTPPSLQMTLTPTVLWPADHRLVRIDATVTSSDSCGSAPVQVVLTSITNSQADNGLGDGDTARDIQEASYGTFDTTFLLRAERAGNDTAGRTYTIKYTATDASGNQTPMTTTVSVPLSQ